MKHFCFFIIMLILVTSCTVLVAACGNTQAGQKLPKPAEDGAIYVDADEDCTLRVCRHAYTLGVRHHFPSYCFEIQRAEMRKFLGLDKDDDDENTDKHVRCEEKNSSRDVRDERN